MYERGDAEGFLVVDRWEHGVGWIAHPDEESRRTGHAVVDPSTEDVWLLDPLRAPGVDDLIGEQSVGRVAGVLVCSDYHVRDAEHFAEQYDVPVTVPASLDRAAGRIDRAVERTEGPVAGFEFRTLRPLYAWREVVAHRPADGTLYVPDFLTSCEPFLVGGERLAMPTLSRLRPPADRFADLNLDRIVLGHGEGIFEDPEGALEEALTNARRRFPRALRTQFPRELRAFYGALG